MPHILIWLICWFTYSFTQQLYIWQFGFSGNPKITTDHRRCFYRHCNLVTETKHTHNVTNLVSQFSCSFMSDSLQPHGLKHTSLPCPSPTPTACSNSCPLSRWCHPTISSSANPFSPRLQCFPASGSFQTSQFFASGSQSIGVSASAYVIPMNIQDWFPLGWTGWISLQSKGLSRVFSIQIVKLLVLVLWKIPLVAW